MDVGGVWGMGVAIQRRVLHTGRASRWEDSRLRDKARRVLVAGQGIAATEVSDSAIETGTLWQEVGGGGRAGLLGGEAGSVSDGRGTVVCAQHLKTVWRVEGGQGDAELSRDACEGVMVVMVGGASQHVVPVNYLLDHV